MIQRASLFVLRAVLGLSPYVVWSHPHAVVRRVGIAYYFSDKFALGITLADFLMEKKPINDDGKVVALNFVKDVVPADKVDLVKYLLRLLLCGSWRGLSATQILQVRIRQNFRLLHPPSKFLEAKHDVICN
jgi:hypothetical protein